MDPMTMPRNYALNRVIDTLSRVGVFRRLPEADALVGAVQVNEQNRLGAVNHV